MTDMAERWAHACVVSVQDVAGKRMCAVLVECDGDPVQEVHALLKHAAEAERLNKPFRKPGVAENEFVMADPKLTVALPQVAMSPPKSEPPKPAKKKRKKVSK